MDILPLLCSIDANFCIENLSDGYGDDTEFEIRFCLVWSSKFGWETDEIFKKFIEHETHLVGKY